MGRQREARTQFIGRRSGGFPNWAILRPLCASVSSPNRYCENKMSPDCSARNVISAAVSSSSECFALRGKSLPPPHFPPSPQPPLHPCPSSSSCPPPPSSSQRGKWEIYFGQIAKTILQKREAIQPQSKAIEACNKFPAAVPCSARFSPRRQLKKLNFLVKYSPC